MQTKIWLPVIVGAIIFIYVLLVPIFTIYGASLQRKLEKLLGKRRKIKI